MSARFDDPLTFRPPPRARRLRLVLGLPLVALLVAIVGGTTFLLWAPHELRYEVSDGALVVSSGPRPLVDHRRVPLTDISGVDPVELGRGRKVRGTNMPGYCVGVYRYRELGTVWQATDCSAAAVVVGVRGESRPLVLTPADRQALIAALERGDRYVDRPAERAPGSSWSPVMLLPLVTVPVAVIAAAVFLVAPGRLRYRVDGDAVEVTTVFGRRRFALAGCRARRHTAKIGLRLWGTSVPGYFTGWFLADGRRTRVYATTASDGVLIEGDALRLFLSPAEPDRFLEMLHAFGVD